MNDNDFESALRRAYFKREQDVSKRQVKRTENCPSLMRFAEALDNGWQAAERRHISDCEYCQKLMLYEWRLNPPGLWRLIEFVAGVLPDRRAMAMYIEENAAYARLQNSVVVRALARVLRELEGLSGSDEGVGRIGELATFFANGLTRPVVLTRGSSAHSEDRLRRVRNYTQAVAVASVSDENGSRDHDFSIDLPDGSVYVKVAQQNTELSITATASNGRNAGRLLLVEVLSDDFAPISVEILIEETRLGEQPIGRATVRLDGDVIPPNLTVVAMWRS